MSRYSSDSDSSSYHRQGRRKRRSPSASSSDSGRHRRSKSSKHSISHYRKSSKRYRSRSYKRSRSRSKNSSRRSRSASKERHRRSHSREKYRSKYHYKSRVHSNSRSTKYHSRSSSSDSKNSTSSSNSSKSSSAGNNKKNNSDTKKNFSSDLTSNQDEQLREKLLKAIKAAESADHQLKQQGVLPKCVKSRNDISNLAQTQPQSETLKDINADVFVPKTFKSSKQAKEKNVDDLNLSNDADLFHSTDTENSVFHSSFFIDPKSKLDWWVKKLYQVRQRAISGEPLA